jgi:hypothetical protein
VREIYSHWKGRQMALIFHYALPRARQFCGDHSISPADFQWYNSHFRKTEASSWLQLQMQIGIPLRI